MFCRMDLSWLCCILQNGFELVMMHSAEWICAGYAVLCRMDLSWLCCTLLNGFELVMLYSAEWI